MAIIEVANNRALVYRKQGKYKPALKILTKTLKYYKHHKHTDGIIATWENMAVIYSNIGMSSKSSLLYDSCINLAKKEGSLIRLKDIYHDIYFFYDEHGKHKEALNAYIHYHEVADSIFNLEKAELITELLVKYEKEKDQLQILELENENLIRTEERNLLIFFILGIVLVVVFMVIFFLYKHKKNKIISEHKIKQLEEEKRHLAARFLVEGEEKERKRLAMELHDNLGVLLSATKMQFREIRDKSPDNAELISKASKFLDQASKDVRQISHNLMPGLLTKMGLFEALEDLFENLNEQENFDALIEVIGPHERLDENKEIMIYRIIQEIVNNTIKHADANKIDLTIIVDAEEINISYADNGKGFNVSEELGNKTLGLQSIWSRVKFLNGRIKIDSDKNSGTVYRICFPLDEGMCNSFPE